MVDLRHTLHLKVDQLLHYTINDKFLTGPTEASMDDFWRMIWEHNTTTIVMLTGLLENGKVGRRIYHNSRLYFNHTQLKCHRYWPLCYSGNDTVSYWL